MKVINFLIKDMEAKPAQRGRVAKNGCFYSPSSKAEKILSCIMRTKANFTIEGKFYLGVVLGFSKNPRGDIDNYAKYVMDAIQKAGIITNDKNCMEIYCKMNCNSSSYIEVTIKELEYE